MPRSSRGPARIYACLVRTSPRCSVTQSIREEVEAQGSGNRLVKFLASRAVRHRLARYSGELQEPDQEFHVRRVLFPPAFSFLMPAPWNYQLAVPKRNLSTVSRIPKDEYRILRAVGCFRTFLLMYRICSHLFQRPLICQELEILDNIQAPKRHPSFWLGTVRAKVHGEVRIVKVFHTKLGGHEAFERSLLQLDCGP